MPKGKCKDRPVFVPEIATQPDGVRVGALCSPFTVNRVDRVVPFGKTVAEIVFESFADMPEYRRPGEHSGVAVRVWLRGQLVPEAVWQFVKPKEGELLLIRAVPQGGSGSGRKAIAIIIAVAAMVLGAWVGAQAWGPMLGSGDKAIGLGSVLGSAVIGLGAAMAISAIVKAPSVKSMELEGPSPDITGTRNQALPYQPIPRVYGKHKLYPPLGAMPFTEALGDEQYLRMIFNCGYGPLVLSDLKIGDTPIEDFAEVEWVVNPNHTPDGEAPTVTVDVLDFDGDGDYVTVPHASTLDLGRTGLIDGNPPALTIEARARIHSFTTDKAPLISKGTNYRLWVESDGSLHGSIKMLVTKAFVTKSVEVYSPAGAVPINTDVMCGMALNDNVITLYVDGQPIISKTISTKTPFVTTDSENLLFGSDADSNYLDGYIHEVRLWTIAKNEYDIQEYAHEDIDSDETGLTGLWLIDEGTGSTVADSTANGNDGAITGASWEEIEVIHRAVFSNDVFEDNPSIPIHNESGWIQRTTAEADEISIEISLPAGLNRTTSDGGYDTLDVSIEAQYRAVGDEDWIDLITWDLEDLTKKQIRKTKRWNVERGRYEVRVRRTTPDRYTMTRRTYTDIVYFSAIRSIKYVNPIQMSGVTTVSIRIKASDQLNGIIDNFNCIAEAALPVYDGAAWATQLTRNPAWAYVNVLTGSANARAIATTRLDLTAIKAWADWCDTNEFYFDSVIDYRTSVFELLQQIASVGRAAFHVSESLYSVVQDTAQTTPVQHFTPRNSWGYSGKRTFTQAPHALKMKFTDPDADWQQNERIVYDDGYSESGGLAQQPDGSWVDTEAATRFETIELQGVTDADQAWKMGRYYLAVGRLRQEVHTFNVDIEYLACQRGDLILFNHDVILAGLGSARVKSVTLNELGDCTGFTIDDSFAMEEGGVYSCRFRLADGTSIIHAVDTVAGYNSTLTFATAIPSGSDQPAAGDLVMFGETDSETIELIVRDITPRNDLSAQLVCLAAAPAVHTAATGTIPPWDSQISLPVNVQPVTPLRPVIQRIWSDESAIVRGPDGSLISRILIQLSEQADPTRPKIAGYQCDMRRADSEEQYRRIGSFVGNDIAIPEVDDGETYSIRLRSVSEYGITSDWRVVEHTVIGKTSLPPDVTALFFSGQRLSWTYPDPKPIDFAGYRVRVHRGSTNTHWASGQQLHLDLVRDNSFTIFLPSGDYVFMVKAVDVAGNESATAKTLAAAHTLDTSGYVFLYFESLLGGTLSVSGGTYDPYGSAYAADVSASFYCNGNNKEWVSDSGSFWDTLYKEMTIERHLSASKIDTMCGGVYPCFIHVDPNISADWYSIEYRTGEDPLFWSKEDSEYFWDSDSDLFWTNVYEPLIDTIRVDSETQFPNGIWIRFVCAGGRVRAVAYPLNSDLLVYAQEIIAYLDDVSIDAAGERLSISAYGFDTIQTVTATIQGSTGSGVYVRVHDKDATLGPEVRAYDASGNGVAAVCDFVLRGY